MTNGQPSGPEERLPESQPQPQSERQLKSQPDSQPDSQPESLPAAPADGETDARTDVAPLQPSAGNPGDADPAGPAESRRPPSASVPPDPDAEAPNPESAPPERGADGADGAGNAEDAVGSDGAGAEPPPPELPPTNPLTVNLSYDRCINFALQQNDVPVVKHLSIHNASDADLENVELRIWIDHDLSDVVAHRQARLRVGDDWIFDGLGLPLRATTLLRQTERERATLHVELLWDGRVGHREEFSIDLLAYNEWGGLDSLPEILAAFVTPNEAAVGRILGLARAELAAVTGDGGLTGYQQGGPARARALVEACYAAVAGWKLGYINPPASFEVRGQKVRFPAVIEEQRLATCLDLALLMAGCLEQCGLHPLVFMVEGHAFVGAWTSDTCLPEPCTDDGVRMRKQIRVGHIVAFETTLLTSATPVPFEAAERDALRYLDREESFVCAIDVRAARKFRIRPLPLRQPMTSETGEATSAETLQAGAEDLTARSPVAMPPALSTVPLSAVPPSAADSLAPPEVPAEGAATNSAGSDGSDKPRTAAERLQNWKHKLLDLSLRNRLINTRETKRTVPLMLHDLGAVEDVFAGGKAFTVRPRPRIAEEDGPRDLDLHRERTHEDLVGSYLADQLKSRTLHANLDEETLGERLLEIYRAARNALEETGVNTLFLVLGNLAWFDPDAPDKQRLAPILLLPVQITRKSVHDGFRIRLADDDPRINVTLLKKLAAEFQVDTSRLGELPEDEAGLDVHEILQRFRRAVINLSGWDVVETAQLGMFSFSKFLMWQDLEENSGALMQSPVVRHLVETPGEAFDDVDVPWPALDELDSGYPPADVFCPLDADSSQLRAIFAAQSGKTFVLQGPPGTGKSQTITNLIAHALGHGQRVLFVAEKMAALEVVYDRLAKIGLDTACLELHSHKASKRQVLDQIRRTLEQTGVREPADWEARTDRLSARRTELNGYVAAVHAEAPCGLSFFAATSKLIELRDVPRLELELGDVSTVDARGLRAQHDALEEAVAAANGVGDPAEHPLRALAIEEFRTGLVRDLESAADSLRDAARALTTARLDLGATLALPGATTEETPSVADSADFLGLLVELAESLLQSPRPERGLLTEPGFAEIRQQLVEQLVAGRTRDELRADLLTRFEEPFLDQDPREWESRLQDVEDSFVLVRWWRQRGFQRDLKRFTKGAVPEAAQLRDSLLSLRDVRQRTAALAAPDNYGAAMFGRRWRGGEADWDQLQDQLEWVEEFRRLILRLQDTPIGEDAALRVRDRARLLATDENDLIQDGAPHRLRLQGFCDRHREFGTAVDAARLSVQLEPMVAFGDPSGIDYLPQVESWADEVVRHRGGLRDWAHWRRCRAACGRLGLGRLMTGLDSGTVDAAMARSVFDRDFLEHLIDHCMDSSAPLRQFSSRDHERRIGEFRRLDEEVMELSQQVVQARLAARVPKMQERASDRSEMGILARQLKLQRRHMSIRRLFESLPTLLPRLKPCLLMSPLSVAQFLSDKFVPADLVIFDEASQIPVWDAIGALARGSNAVVVGDSRQLPPTSFFQLGEGDIELSDEVDAIRDLESILEECEAGGLQTLDLDWHYRSRHESLIAFSNHHYYNDRLLTFPSVTADAVPGLGVSMRLIDGVYDKGKGRTNRKEAEAICAEIVARLQRFAAGEEEPRSLGVVAFSQVQQRLIEDLLEAERQTHPEIEPFFGSGVKEEVFIKNLENVQGDERDTIMFSICYGPDEQGKVSMNFGPLNRQGGERRLNVAITRARRELLVFTSIGADKIDLRRTQAVGVRHLRQFLAYAQAGTRVWAAPEAERMDPAAMPFEQAVAGALRDAGHEVELRVGCSGYRIDLAVRHPEDATRFVLGIECDGAAYHSAATARDRDRTRASVLRGLGWQLHRVWSTDWWEDRDRELRRLDEAITRAVRLRSVDSGDGSEVAAAEESAVADDERLIDEPAEAAGSAQADDAETPADSEEEAAAEAIEAELPESLGGTEAFAGRAEPGAADSPQQVGDEDGVSAVEDEVSALDLPEDPPHPHRQLYPSREASPKIGKPEDIYTEATLPQFAALAQRLVTREGPIRVHSLCKIIGMSFGVERVSAKVRDRLEVALATLPVDQRPVLRGEFAWAAGQDPGAWRTFRVPAHADQKSRSAEEVPVEEVANAASFVLETQFSQPVEDLERETARLLGLNIGPKIRQHMHAGVRLLADRDGCRIEGDTVLPVETS